MSVDGSGLEATWSGYRCTELHIWTPAIGLLPLSLQGLAGIGLHDLLGNQGWVPGKRFIRVRAKHSPFNKSYSSRLWSVQLSIASFKSLPTKIINMEAVLFAYFMLLGKS